MSSAVNVREASAKLFDYMTSVTGPSLPFAWPGHIHDHPKAEIAWDMSNRTSRSSTTGRSASHHPPDLARHGTVQKVHPRIQAVACRHDILRDIRSAVIQCSARTHSVVHSADALASHWPGVQKLDKNKTRIHNGVGFGGAAARFRATAGASSTPRGRSPEARAPPMRFVRVPVVDQPTIVGSRPEAPAGGYEVEWKWRRKGLKTLNLRREVVWAPRPRTPKIW